MNQILTMQKENEPNKNLKNNKKTKKNYVSYNQNGKTDIQKIIRIFSIIIIVFGIVLIGKSTYAIINSRPKQVDTPQVTTERMGSKVNFTITTEKPIKELSYKWNDGELTTIQGNGTVSMMQTISIPNGNNILKITVIDYYGNKTYYQNQYIKESPAETEPTIDIAITGTKLKITATDDTEISYITYKWNDEEETRINAEKGKKTIETELDVRKGTNKLSIIAVDSEENRGIRNQTIIGANKPTFTISTQGQNLVISAKDDNGISKITVDVDGNATDSGSTSLNQKEINATVPIGTGTHTIKVTVTNINGLSDTKELTA